MNRNKPKLCVLLLMALLFRTNAGVSQSDVKSCNVTCNIVDRRICLPELSGMTECFNQSKVKSYVDSRTIDGNINLAFYLENKNLSEINDLSAAVLESYLIVFTTQTWEKEEVSREDILKLNELMYPDYNSYTNSTWKDVQDKLSNKVPTLEVDQPVLIDHYFTITNSPCFITLTRSKEHEVERFFLTGTVLNEINGKFVVFAWYLKYEDRESVSKIKSKIDYFTAIVSQLNESSIDTREEIKANDSKSLETAVGHYNQAYVLSNEGQYAKAIEEYTKAIESYPDNQKLKISEAYYNRGINRRLMNDIKGAIDDYSSAIKLRPDYYKAYHNRGVARLKSEEFDGAISDFNFIIKSNINDKSLLGSTYGNRGIAKDSKGIDGCPDLKKAVELGANNFQKLLNFCE